MTIDVGKGRLQFLPITLAQRGHGDTHLAFPSCHDRRQNSFALLSRAYVGIKTDGSHLALKFSSQNFFLFLPSAAELFPVSIALFLPIPLFDCSSSPGQPKFPLMLHLSEPEWFVVFKRIFLEIQR